MLLFLGSTCIFYNKEAICLISKLLIGDTVIKCREEDCGYYTIFDGNISIQINNTFYYVLNCLSHNLKVEDIVEKFSKEFNLEKTDKNQIKEDVEYVINFAKNKKWI